MSKGSRRPRIVQQRNLFGGLSVLELHGEGGRTRANEFQCTSPSHAAQLIAGDVRFHGAEVVTVATDLPAEGHCPNCGHQGDLVHDFGTRLMGSRRVPQSWCRACRRSNSQRRQKSSTT